MHYLGSNPDAAGKVKAPKAASHGFDLKRHFVGQLTATGFLPFTLLGVAGAVKGYSHSSTVRLLTHWLAALLLFSTMIAWSYYGEKGAEYLFGASAILPFKFAFVVFVFLGMVLPKFDVVVNFSDATTGMMVLCNLPAILVLSPVVMRAARDYFRRLDNGEMPRLLRRQVFILRLHARVGVLDGGIAPRQAPGQSALVLDPTAHALVERL